jgi:hypothetical protein
MDVENLLHSLTTRGLTLSLGEALETIAVVGPGALLSLAQQWNTSRRCLRCAHDQQLILFLKISSQKIPS